MTARLRRRLRWRKATTGELETIAGRLERWPSEAGGAARHMFALSAIESFGAEPVRIAADDTDWAVAIVFPGRLIVPCGDAAAIRRAAPPSRRWRLMVGDLDAGDALLERSGPDPGLIVHDQRFLTVDPDRVPDGHAVPDPGLRRAQEEDLDRLAELAVQLHVDDRFGPNPGKVGWRGYRSRLEATTKQGLVSCVGPVGAPVFKVERSVSSRRFGVQLAGIVTAPEARGQGIGSGAVAAAVRQALVEGPRTRAISLHVREDNVPALTAYDRAGFVDREAWRLAVRR
ncbi:MAG: GNAT family N-acetyltransferase [Nitriliruptoraceae bacterium]|nr:GNAT family N-acetyltransferase [Nitriliruptoraceae bacterium]